MTAEELELRLREIRGESLPELAGGDTKARHRRLYDVGREDLSLAKLAEAHWDAQSILREAGREPVPGALYAVWASELPGHPLQLTPSSAGGWRLAGTKHFASGATLVDRALVTAVAPGPVLVEVDLRRHSSLIHFDGSAWCTPAFALTRTGAVTFSDVEVSPADLVGGPGFYLERAGFWAGACGPAACWAGGAAGLLDEARHSHRGDPHTLAHLAAMHSGVWALEALLARAGEEIDALGANRPALLRCALTLRHLVEQLATDVLRRFARAYGPQPLSMNENVSRRYLELDLSLRQSHGERDLAALGEALLKG